MPPEVGAAAARGGAVGHGRHPRRHRAVLDRRGARARRAVRRHVDGRARQGAGGQRPARVGALHQGARRRPARTRADRRRAARPAWSRGCARRCRGGRAPRAARRAAPPAACRAPSSPCRGRRWPTRSWPRCGPDTFDVVVTGDRVPRGKPHPDPYLTAARALGVEPARLRRHRGLPDRRDVGRGRRRADAGGAARRARAAGARAVARQLPRRDHRGRPRPHRRRARASTSSCPDSGAAAPPPLHRQRRGVTRC